MKVAIYLFILAIIMVSWRVLRFFYYRKYPEKRPKEGDNNDNK